MRHYLVIYDRAEGKIIRHHAFRRSDRAMEARFAAEREFAGRSEIEVVVLGAKSWASLPQTHSRYFKGARELAEAALTHVAPSEA